MSSPDELRSYAVDCARLARGANGSEEKARLLNMAQAWSYLTARIERLGRFAKGSPGNGDAAPDPDAETAPPRWDGNPR